MLNLYKEYHNISSVKSVDEILQSFHFLQSKYRIKNVLELLNNILSFNTFRHTSKEIDKDVNIEELNSAETDEIKCRNKFSETT